MHWISLDPLFTGVVLLVKNAAAFTQAVSTRRTGTASTPSIGIAKHIVVVNVVKGLANVCVKEFPHGSTVVTNQGPACLASGKTRLVANAILPFSILAKVVLGGENVKLSLQLAL
jgi:hypothetical protein